MASYLLYIQDYYDEPARIFSIEAALELDNPQLISRTESFLYRGI